MRAERWSRVAGAFAAVLVVFGIACNSLDEPVGGIPAPSELSAEALGLGTVRVSWRPAASADVAGYELQRRTDLRGEFETIETSLPGGGSNRAAYFDTRVEPNRYYGYRVRAVSRLGARSAMSNIAGAKTSAMPGLLIHTLTEFVTAESADPDGYVAVIRKGTDSTSVPLAINAERLVTPIARGTYSVVIRGLANNCAPKTLGDTVKPAVITDEGTQTVIGVDFNISCRDPRKASIVAILRTIGDTSDADGLLVTASGIIREPGTPANERVYFQTQPLAGANGAVRFDNLRPGDYEISIADIDAPCVLNGERKQTLQPKALAVDTVRFGLTCRKPEVPVDTAGRPFILRQAWSAASARPGDKVSLLTALDLRAQPAQKVSGASATIQFDNAVVRYDSSVTTGAFDITTVVPNAPNVLGLVAATAGGQLSGNVQIVRTWYTVIGAVGTSVRTATTLSDVLDPQLALLNNKIRIEESTLNIAAGGGPSNQPPTATITGPITGLVGASVTFSGSQSIDSDGTIATYAWSFGDSSTGSGVSASHTYVAAGSYTVRLTVTDDRGATGTRDQTIVTSAPGANTGTIAGTVTSTQQGPIAGATVTVAGGLSATTSATGAYSIANVAVGSQSVTVSALPTGCTAPAAQSVTVAAGATAPLNFTVTCTTTATTGAVSGRVTRESGGAGIGFARVQLQPAGGALLPLVTTGADGSYTVSNVPVGTGANAGTGALTLTDLPTGCTAPTGQAYTGLTAGGTATKDIVVTCQTATTGTVTGTITRSIGGAITGAQVTVTPTGGAALPGVSTNAAGLYTVGSVPPGGGAIALSGLPTGCTNPGPQSYTGLVAGSSVTKDITVTCVAGPHTYPLTAAWGAISTGGPTGRQATLTLSIDMGGAPGRPDIAGAAADPLSGISFNFAYNGLLHLGYSSNAGAPSQFNLVTVNENNAGTADATASAAITSTSGATRTGAFQLIQLTFNIKAGFSGPIASTLIVTEALATIGLIEVTTSVVVQPVPILNVP